MTPLLIFSILLILPICTLTSPVDLVLPPTLYADPIEILEENLADAVNYRLPNNTKPNHYRLDITTHVHKHITEFTGRNIIEFTAKGNSRSITLHARQLSIVEARLNNANNMLMQIEYDKVPHPVTEFLTFNLTKEEEMLEDGKIYILEIVYSGKLRTDNGGFYLSKYINSAKNEVYLATTQFESTDARHGFPCFDEPGIKAQFTIKITHGDNYTALSNMPVDGEPIDAEEKGYKVTTFKTTKEMSPYLVAFVVSDFTGKFQDQEHEKEKIKHGVYSRPGTEDERDFPLEASIKVLSAIENYVGFNYTFPKMDQISIPDFAAGAMENWGLVTYREEMLLYHPKRSTINTQTVVATTVAHEYGHQWFGNLVSPKWWTYLWLNEGFASLFAYVGSDIAYPEWDLMEHYIVAEYQRALTSDEGKDKRPMTHYVEAPRSIVSLFDSVSYSKASCVIRMMKHYLGEKVFKNALTKYLTKMQYKAAVEEDLFESFQTAAKEESIAVSATIDEIMGSWSRQGGFPLVTVTRDYEKGTFKLKQEGFNNAETPDDKRSWFIPFNYVTAKDPNFNETAYSGMMNKGQNELEVSPKDDEKIGEEDWLILNKQLTSYYRVNYDEKNWKLISDALNKKHSDIHKYNRAQLIFDGYRLSLIKKVKLDIFFDMLAYMEHETEYSPWTTANSILQYYKEKFHGDSELYNNMKFYISIIVKNIYEKLDVKENENDRHFDKYVRTIAINWACASGIETCLKNTNDRLKELVNDKKEIEPNLQSVIYCNGLKTGDETEFNYMFDRLMASDDQAERQLIMATLGCSHNEEYLKKFAKSSIDKSVELRPQERINVLKSIYSKGEDGFKAVVKFLTEDKNFELYADLLPGFGQANPLDVAVKALSLVVVNEEQKKMLEELVELVKDHPKVDKDLSSKVQNNMKSNLDWIKDNREPVLDYLSKFMKARKDSASQIVLSIVPLSLSVMLSLKFLF